MDRYRIIRNKITVAEYQLLRHTTNWFQIEDSVVEKSLNNDLFSVTIYDDKKLIGMGRVVGDGAIYFYVQDIIVIPEYQGRGIGKLIMNTIEAYLSESAYNNSFVGLMAARGVAGFYYNFGYKERDNERPGMSKLIKKP
jgi:GNAT superfamily N-acetyltransferase